MNNPIRLTVMRDDLKGAYVDKRDCPIARAAKRTFGINPITDEVVVSDESIYAWINQMPKHYSLSPKDDSKARARSRSLWGMIVGGWTMEIYEI